MAITWGSLMMGLSFICGCMVTLLEAPVTYGGVALCMTVILQGGDNGTLCDLHWL